MFDSQKTGKIEKEKVRTILNTLGHTFDDHELESLLKQEDEEGNFVFDKICWLTWSNSLNNNKKVF